MTSVISSCNHVSKYFFNLGNMSCLWKVKFRDAYRAQYYLPYLKRSEKELKEQLTKTSQKVPLTNKDDITSSIIKEIGDQLDGIILPSVAKEVHESKNDLQATTPEGRYKEFYVKEEKWTDRAKGLPQKYPHLFKMVERFCESTTNCVANAFKGLMVDSELLVKKRFLNKTSTLINCKIGLCDRHRGGRSVVVLEFTGERKLVMKPSDLTCEILLQQFTSLLNLKPPYDLKFRSVIVCEGYSWGEYIHHKPCKSEAEVNDFYRRAGVLTAVLDSLNYCDGHFENVIAFGAYPALIDCETLFHCSEEGTISAIPEELAERSILYTGLVEKPPKKEEMRGYSSAFQTPPTKRFYYLRPFAVDDHTDNLHVNFRGLHDESFQHSPTYEGKQFIANECKNEFIEGFCYAYDKITSAVPIIISANEWWEKLQSTKVRQLIRHTMFYELCMRRIQQPECCQDLFKADQVVRDLLSGKESKFKLDPFMVFCEQEVKDLLALDIPYFQHSPGECHVYSSDGTVYYNIFKKLTLNDLMERFKDRNAVYRDRQIEIISNVLIPTEYVLRQMQ